MQLVRKMESGEWRMKTRVVCGVGSGSDSGVKVWSGEWSGEPT